MARGRSRFGRSSLLGLNNLRAVNALLEQTGVLNENVRSVVGGTKPAVLGALNNSIAGLGEPCKALAQLPLEDSDVTARAGEMSSGVLAIRFPS